MSAISTTYARPMSIAPASYMPKGFIEVACSQCEHPILIPASQRHETAVCSTCRRGEAFRRIADSQEVMRDLIEGTGEYSMLSQAERQEQLDGYSLGSRFTPKALPNVERTVFVPSDEPIYTSDGYEPDAETREWMEIRAEADDAKLNPDAFDADFGVERPALAFE